MAEENLKDTTQEKNKEDNSSATTTTTKKRGRTKLSDMTEEERQKYEKEQEEKKKQKELEKKQQEELEKKLNEFCDVLLPLTFREFNIFKDKCKEVGIETDLCLKLLIEGFVKDKFKFEVARKFYLPDEKPVQENILMSVMGLNNK